MSIGKLVATSLAAASAIDLTWSDCGDASTIGTVTDVQPTSLDLGKNTLTGKGTLTKDEEGGTFKFTAKAGPIPVLSGSGDLCKDSTINLPLGAGSVVFKSVGCPVKAGDIELDIDINILSAEVTNDLVKIAVTAESTSGDSLLCLNLGVASAASEVAAADPEQPQLAQAWTARSKGDGLPNTEGDESYMWIDGKQFDKTKPSFHAHWYKYDDCQKLAIHDPHYTKVGDRTYYLGCDAMDCCYSEDADIKKWDIGGSALSTVEFVGFEDTTELHENPVSQAEHWHEADKVPFTPYSIDYHHFITRADSDVISHRININSTDGLFPPQEILYSNFQVQHDLDAFRESEFQIPAVCQGNILKCDGPSTQKWNAAYFKHDHMRATLKSMSKDVSV